MALKFGRYLALFVVDDLSNPSDSGIDPSNEWVDLCEIPNLARSMAFPKQSDREPFPAISSFGLSSKTAPPWPHLLGKKESRFVRSPAGSSVIENVASLG
jgi:hypothetical protein